MNQFNNLLINETSPYLLQHAHNPVNWHPWTNETFQKAKQEDKPVFLSIGYSTCHWCHVMEEESFEDIEVAEALNTHFIPVKVDREERPDIDSVYMNVCQALTGSGGWPLTIIMTPDKKPFFAGTYFPKHRKHGQTGLLELLKVTAETWENEKESLIRSGNTIAEGIAKFTASISEPYQEPFDAPIKKALTTFTKLYDTKYGGFGSAPKFPSPHNLLFLLHSHTLGLGNDLLPMVENTLAAMYRGGIFDHVGYGFSRYATDTKWLVPHFEKMLYDNALLVIVYTEAYQITNNKLYRYVADKTLDYVKREMTDSSGGFYSAQDADSNGEEGRYYTWQYDEILEVLGAKDGPWFCRQYGVTHEGNFEGKNIINLLHAAKLAVPDAKTEALLKKLLTARLTRFPLHKDDKMLTSWNAMMITAYAKAGMAFQNKEYIRIAEKAADFLFNTMSESGRLKVSYRKGTARGNGLLDDYVYVSWACLTLYNTTFQPKYLAKACGFMKIAAEQFPDKNGGYFLSPADGEVLVYRPKEFYDGAVPSGNSVAAYCFAKLWKLTGDTAWETLLSNQLKAYATLFSNQPTTCSFALTALLFELYPKKELICVLPNQTEIEPIRQELGARHLPQLTVHVITPESQEELCKNIPHFREYVNGLFERPVYYLCTNKGCLPPSHDFQDVLRQLEEDKIL